MTYGAQLIEKNHFLGVENRAKHDSMNSRPEDITRRRTRIFLLLMVVTLIAAIIAPVAVLAAG